MKISTCLYAYSLSALFRALKIGLSKYSMTVRLPVIMSTDAVMPGMIGNESSLLRPVSFVLTLTK